jgi:hypothetical protein
LLALRLALRQVIWKKSTLDTSVWCRSCHLAGNLSDTDGGGTTVPHRRNDPDGGHGRGLPILAMLTPRVVDGQSRGSRERQVIC